MMLMMPGAGAGVGGGVAKRSIAHLRPLPPQRSLPPVCAFVPPPLGWGASTL